ncbi:hypothetical protein SAMN04488540_12441 [Ferrimonas sediminum]|uniref:Uncharacterized protein n=1 Tax=Ferrimonas sediminum TaxID=718193 RepID=A0A1G9ANN8_9GAMM|nr:hypothetical protein [Ferrimonas sediminum]SDK28979.1 hypothetical protein SAMN04488540_12441 [Ferrimonas sediminum]
MGRLYRRTQFSVWMIVGLSLLIVTFWWQGCDSLPVLLLSSLVLVVGALFSSLTIEVHQGFVRWYFGPRVWRRQIRINQIDAVSVVSRDQDGRWPVHLGRSGWAYQVSGHYSVELMLRCGKIIRLGTDCPDEVVAAIMTERNKLTDE